MNFRFSEELIAARSAFQRFLAKHASVEAKLRAEALPAGYDPGVWKDIAGLGWLASLACESDDDIQIIGILAEELGRASFASPLLSCAAAGIVLSRAARTQASSALERLGLGTELLSLAAGEYERPTLIATRIDGGGVSLAGGPILIEWGGAADAVIVPIRLDGTWHIAYVLRDPKALDVDDVRPFDNSRAASMTFRRVLVPADRIHPIDDNILRDAIGLGQLLVALEGVGGARGALDLTTSYVKERVQFGKPIGTFQAIKHALSDARGLIDGAWLAGWEGLSKAVNGESVGGSPALACWLAKRAFQDMAVKGAQFHGGMGHTVDSQMQFFYRRAGTLHGRCSSEWSLLGQIAASYVVPKFDAIVT